MDENGNSLGDLTPRVLLYVAWSKAAKAQRAAWGLYQISPSADSLEAWREARRKEDAALNAYIDSQSGGKL